METESYYVAQAALELLSSHKSPISNSQSAKNIGVSNLILLQFPVIIISNDKKYYMSTNLKGIRLPLQKCHSPGFQESTATATSQVQTILLPQPPEQPGLQARPTTPG